VINPLTLIPLPWKIGGALALAGGLAAAGVAYHHHVYQQGVSAESVRRDVIEAANSKRADDERAALNKRIAAVQADLDKARTRVAELSRDYENEKAISAQRKRALAAGDERMQILARKRSADPHGPPSGAATGTVDSGSRSDTYDIDPAVAANLEQLRADHNGAIKALNACVEQYDALKSAADAMP
jgi:Skp family chaperone for outer membrane proteins